MSIRLQPDLAVTNAAVGRTGETEQTGSVANASSGRFSGRSTTTDKVQISGPSSALNQLATERAARIDQLRALVQGGSYDVSSAKVGQAVVGNAVSGGG